MNPLSNVVPFELPKRPKVIEKAEQPNQRSFCVIPWRAVVDDRLTPHQLKTLAAVASYCNKAGITWVSQSKVGQDLGISKQAINKHMQILMQLGYIEVMSKGFKGVKGQTIRLIYKEGIEAEDALSIASAGTDEDLRPPEIKQREDKQFMEPEEITEEQARENQKRLASMLASAFKRPAEANQKVYQPVKGDTMTVKKMKQEIEKKRKQQRHSQPNRVDNDPVDNFSHSQPLRVDNEERHSQLHSQLHGQPLRVDQPKKKTIEDSIYIGFNNIKDKVLSLSLDNLNESNLRYIEMLDSLKVTNQQIDDAMRGKPKATIKETVDRIVDYMLRNG